MFVLCCCTFSASFFFFGCWFAIEVVPRRVCCSYCWLPLAAVAAVVVVVVAVDVVAALDTPSKFTALINTPFMQNLLFYPEPFLI